MGYMKFKIQRAGSYVVKSAESQASRVVPKIGPVRPQSSPSGQQVARAVRERKQQSTSS
jgi:hypothetical protein